jgi:hypothetical protein
VHGHVTNKGTTNYMEGIDVTKLKWKGDGDRETSNAQNRPCNLHQAYLAHRCCVHAMHQGQIQAQCLPQLCFAWTLFQSMLTITSYFPEFFLYLLSLWATVCFISFVLYRRHSVVLCKPTRDSNPRGAHSRRVDFESARSQTV